MTNYKFKIQELSFKTGSDIINLKPRAINIFVGPNNSGKSRILKEIRDWLSGDSGEIGILENIEFDFPETFEVLDDAYNITSMMQKDYYGNWFFGGYSNKPTQPFDMNTTYESYFARQARVYSSEWRNTFSNAIKQKSKQQFLEFFGSLFFRYLGTEERLMICKSQTNYGLDNATKNYLSDVRFKHRALNELSKITQKLFDVDIALDTQTLGTRLCFRVGKDLDTLKHTNQLSEAEAKELYNKDMLDDQGDGIKNFVSVFLSLKCNDQGALLLDEPEAFLHPPLARQLGEIIGNTADSDRPIFIATHSVEILKGILSKSSDVQIIRITRPRLNSNKFTFIQKETLNKVLETPLLRVSRVLEGIFCEKVVLTESEADELIYQEFIEKVFPESGLHFVHAQNKQTLGDIAQLYREIGVAFEILVDFDILREPKEFTKLMTSIGIPIEMSSKFSQYAAQLRVQVDNSVKEGNLSSDEIESKQRKVRDKVYHKEGIRWFSEDLRSKIKDTLNVLDNYHLHILRSGELETFLEEYGLDYLADKKSWVMNAINKIASLDKEELVESAAAYNFIERVVNNPES